MSEFMSQSFTLKQVVNSFELFYILFDDSY